MKNPELVIVAVCTAILSLAIVFIALYFDRKKKIPQGR